MHVVGQLLYLVILLFVIVLLVRLVLDLVQFFAREWRPSGVALVIAEVAYSISDPPLKLFRRILPPVTIGSVRFDLAFTVLFIVCLVAMSVFASL